MKVHSGIEGDVVVEEGLPQDCDEVAAHGEQDVGVHEGDAGGRSPGDDDPHKGGLCDSRAGGCKGIVWGERLKGVSVCLELRAITLPATRGQPPVWLHQEKVTGDGAVWGQRHDSPCQNPQSCWVTRSPWRSREGIVLLCCAPWYCVLK